MIDGLGGVYKTRNLESSSLPMVPFCGINMRRTGVHDSMTRTRTDGPAVQSRGCMSSRWLPQVQYRDSGGLLPRLQPQYNTSRI